jgi:hypothetical protein
MRMSCQSACASCKSTTPPQALFVPEKTPQTATIAVAHRPHLALTLVQYSGLPTGATHQSNTALPLHLQLNQILQSNQTLTTTLVRWRTSHRISSSTLHANPPRSSAPRQPSSTSQYQRASPPPTTSPRHTATGKPPRKHQNHSRSNRSPTSQLAMSGPPEPPQIES